MKNIMIDLETLGNNVNSPIISLSAVQFDPKTGETGLEFDKAVKIEDVMDNYPLTKATGGTIKWWLAQDKEAQNILLTKQRTSNTLHSVISSFECFLLNISKNGTILWGNSARFDIGILQHSFNVCGFRYLPWKYTNEMCARTLFNLDPEIRNDTKFNGIPHNGIDDCKFQIECIHKIYQKFNF